MHSPLRPAAAGSGLALQFILPQGRSSDCAFCAFFFSLEESAFEEEQRRRVQKTVPRPASCPYACLRRNRVVLT